MGPGPGLSTLPGWVGRTYSLSHRGELPAPGYMPVTAAALGVITAPSGCTVRDRGAQGGRTPWVRDPWIPPGVESVTDDRQLCAELLRLLG